MLKKSNEVDQTTLKGTRPLHAAIFLIWKNLASNKAEAHMHCCSILLHVLIRGIEPCPPILPCSLGFEEGVGVEYFGQRLSKDIRTLRLSLSYMGYAAFLAEYGSQFI